MLRDILLGIVGGIVGGVVFRALGGHGVTGFNLWSILVAFIGGIVVLVLYHAIIGPRRGIAPQALVRRGGRTCLPMPEDAATKIQLHLCGSCLPSFERLLEHPCRGRARNERDASDRAYDDLCEGL